MSKDTVQIIKIKVDPKQSLRRIDHFLMDRLEGTSRNKIQQAIKDGRVTVDGEEIKPNYKVRPDELIEVSMHKSRVPGEGVQAEEIPLDIVYEDEAVLVVNKPSGMVVHPGVGNFEGTLVNAVKFHLKNQDLPVMPGNLNDRPGLVHRIDKDTSGLLVLAKTEESMTHLAKQFFDHNIHRKYLALVWGEPDPTSGIINAPIGRHPKNRLMNTVLEEDEGGKPAITHYETLISLYYVSLLACRLETGRTHQIRVHMKHIGHTLFNDARYGGDRILKGTVFSKYRKFVENCFEVMPRQGLHAAELGFIHPTTEKEMNFTSDLPDDMAACLDKWEKYVNSRKELL